MTQRVEVNQPVECEIHIGSDRATPDEQHARTCPQCRRSTWASTSLCMWCGHDRYARFTRLAIAIALAVMLAVNISAHF